MRVKVPGGRRWIAAAVVALGVTLVAPAPGSVEGAGTERTPLEQAVWAGQEDRVRELLSQGVPPQEGLSAAAHAGELEILELLLAAAGDAKSFEGAYALALARLAGRESAARRLAAAGADLGVRDAKDRTLLVWAIEEGRMGLVRAVIAADFDLDTASRTGETALMAAARRGDVGSARLLLRAGAATDATDIDGWTALMFAVRAGSLEVVDLLVRARADPEVTSTLGWTPLMLAARDGAVNILRRLLAAKVAVGRRTALQPAPLVQAVKGGHARAVEVLVGAGADPGRGFDGDAMWWSRRGGQKEISAVLSLRAAEIAQ